MWDEGNRSNSNHVGQAVQEIEKQLVILAQTRKDQVFAGVTAFKVLVIIFKQLEA